MQLSKLVQEVYKAENPQEKFLEVHSRKIQLAIYQKLLFKAGEGNELAKAALAAFNDLEFQDKLLLEVREGIIIEQERYAVAKANSIYQDYLYQKALEKAAITKKEDLLFDPQGRLVYELKLTPLEQEEVLKKIELDLSKPEVNGRGGPAVKDGLKKLLGGRTPTDTTLCSIDLSGKEPPHPQKGKDAYLLIRRIYEEKYGAQTIPSDQRASIIASFEETYAHMCLIARTYEAQAAKFDPGGEQISPAAWQEIRKQAAAKIQDEIATLYKKAIEKATSDGVVDVEKLNEVLGKERKSLADFAKKALIEGAVAHLKENGANRAGVLSYMQNLCKRLDKKHTFTQKTATGYDYFHTSNYLQQGMLITGTNDTAHDKPKFDKEKGENQAAFRRISYTYRDKDGALQATSAVSARIPSPALVLDDNMSPDAIIADLAGTPDLKGKAGLKGKYGFLHDEMRAMRGGKNGPVVENLFTSFHSYAYEITFDWGNNRQRTSALYMMEAMHKFNAQQYQKAPESNNFLYVQNIGTNRHTRDLGYQSVRGLGSISGSVELDDITLSAEMAMLHTLKENGAYLNPKIRLLVDDVNDTVLKKYHAYLNQQDRPKYFAESKDGLSLISEIGKFKKQLNTQLKRQKDPEDLPALATNALAKMIATNQHWDIRYGQLSQALSMYMEWASTGGCKSGNERNQDVMLRFGLLKSIHERVDHAGSDEDLQDHEKEIYTQLKNYAKGLETDPDVLRAAISTSISKCNMHGGTEAISREDQGGAAKISSFSAVQDIKNPYLRWAARALVAVVTLVPVVLAMGVTWNTKPWDWYASQVYDTNNAADREMNLNAHGASKTQAHKGQDERTRDIVKDVLKNDDLFKGDAKLKKEELSGFEEDEALCHQVDEPVREPLLSVSPGLGRLSVGGSKSQDTLLDEDVILYEPQAPDPLKAGSVHELDAEHTGPPVVAEMRYK